ncbi:hypothetical protein GGC64_005955 [Mycobacterium sp. OAS707]|uniref:hypothetical protein n=1 Tax=Mycobacterium sp. OAS707 TaxID=2663822 RepID=UPI0017895D03|nr:hypothetical protein [Mycobacterium sp. OAS707]MBE1551868.1 hypothetical protein [Mycobacterium sp. OAS707]
MATPPSNVCRGLRLFGRRRSGSRCAPPVLAPVVAAAPRAYGVDPDKIYADREGLRGWVSGLARWPDLRAAPPQSAVAVAVHG